MSNLKKGDLVEVMGSPSFPELIGVRFTLSVMSKRVVRPSEGFKEVEGECWDSPFKSGRGNTICFKSSHLRKVNPDGDELSSESFNSLLQSLKNTGKKSNIVNIKLRLEE